MTSPLRVEPRWCSKRRSEHSHGPLVARVAELIGWELFDWQRHAADVALQYDPLTRRPLFRTVGIGVARQNGKTTLVVARVATQLIVPKSVVAYTAQDRNIARVKWNEHVELLMDSPFRKRVKRVDRVNGREQLVMDNGARYLIVTPNEKAGRSLTVDLAVIDEAFAQPTMAVVGALKPTMSARAHAQLWLVSNAGSHESKLWRHYTDLGRESIDADDSTLCWVEYAPSVDRPDVRDERAWLEANPTLDLPNGVQSIALRDASHDMSEEGFRREHLNCWPDPTQLIGIDPIAWAACRDDDAQIGDGVVLAVEFTVERDRGTLVAAGPVGDRVALEVIETGDPERIVARAIEVAERWSAPVVVDRGGPAGNAIAALERVGVEVRTISLPDLVKACGDLHDAVVSASIAHRGDYRLADAVASATRRRVGDAWAWARRGGADISPLVAATLARWGVVAQPEALVPRVW